jgi:hypothetical protein
MKIKCECLVDSKTGEPLEIEFPESVTKEQIEKIGISGWEAGQRFKMGLEASKEFYER